MTVDENFWNGLMRTPFSQVIRTVQEVSINRHEYLLTQANFHKRNCGCSATGNGRPEDALKLIQETIIRDLRHLYMTGETPRQTEEENALAEKIMFDKWKATRGNNDES